MLPRLLLIIAVIAAIYWYYNKLRRLPPPQRRPFLLRGILWLIIAAILLAVVTGKMHPLGAAFAALLGFAKFGLAAFMRALPFISFFRRNYNFGSPKFRTQFLSLEINLQTGQVSGEIISGPHSGMSIAGLSEEQLAELEQHYKDKDLRSYYLIKVIRQNIAGRGGQEYTQQERTQFSSIGDPSYQEALQILGIESDPPTRKEIIAAHRLLMQKLHPDRGGNDYLASRVNLAKEVLLKAVEKE